MFSKRRSQLLLVRVKPVGKMTFLIPIPFYLLDIYMRALADLLLLGQLLWPLGLKTVRHHIYAVQGAVKGKTWGKGINISVAGDVLIEVMEELRRYGRWRVVEVRNDEVEVYVDLY